MTEPLFDCSVRFKERFETFIPITPRLTLALSGEGVSRGDPDFSGGRWQDFVMSEKIGSFRNKFMGVWSRPNRSLFEETVYSRFTSLTDNQQDVTARATLLFRVSEDVYLGPSAGVNLHVDKPQSVDVVPYIGFGVVFRFPSRK